MFNKFQCHYKLTLQWWENDQPMQGIVTDPISIEFSVSKALFQSTNSAKIVVYNMDGEIRENIYQDRLVFDKSKAKMVTLEAGYGNKLTLICLGWIQQCYSERQGVDMVTTIEVLDPDILSQYTSVTFQAGTTFDEAYKYLASQFPNLQQGECGELTGTFQTPTVFEGNSFVAINKLTGGHTFIDNGRLNTLNDNETLTDYGAYLIESETGLLETPKRREAILEVNMIFEPTLRLGQMVEIKSETQSRFNGQYKINGISHNCTISGAESGTRTTSIQLIYLEYLTNSNVNLTANPSGTVPSKVVNNKVEPLTTKVSSDVYSTYRYIQNNNGKMPNTFINKILGIKWSDLIGHNNTDNERVQELTMGKLANCEALINRLFQFSNTYFSGKKITITSGWRSVPNNKREGGVSNSQHLRGRAVDFKIAGVNASTVYYTAKRSKMFSYVGKYSTWTHIDVRS